METFSALLAICAGNSPVSGEFPAQRPVTRSFDDFFDLHLDKRLVRLVIETPSRPLWRHYNGFLVWVCLPVTNDYTVHFDLLISEMKPNNHPAHTLCIKTGLLHRRNSIINISSGASYQTRKIEGCACAGNAGNIFAATDFKGNRWLAIPACIMVRAWHTCRDACRDC